MGHEVDLSKYEIRTDLIIDTDYDGFSDKKVFGDIEVSSVSLKEDDASSLSKKPGLYITISFNSLLSSYICTIVFITLIDNNVVTIGNAILKI